MTQNKQLQNPQWTQHYDAYCLENSITPSAQLLWRYLIREGLGVEIEPEFNKFNQWVAKRRKGKYAGKPFSRNCLKAAFNQLVECGIVHIRKQFSKWCDVRIITRPLDWLNPKKNLQNDHKIYASPPSNDLSVDQGLNSSSIDPPSEDELAEMESVLSECQNAGIVFNPVQSPEILQYSLEEVKLAIALFYKRGGHETNWRGKRKIPNPQGWLMACLRRRWYHQASDWSFTDLLAAVGAVL